MIAQTNRRPIRLLRKHIALPQQHGSWALWLGPLAVGVAVAGGFTAGHFWLILSILCIFLSLQPLTIAVKAVAGRKSAGNLQPALVWLSVYGLISLAGAFGLIRFGHGRVLWLGLAALPVLGWHLHLVSRREERGQILAEIAGAGMLALAAPAAYLVGGGDPGTGAVLWFLCSLQAAAAIVHVYLALAYRRMAAFPDFPQRIRLSRKSILLHVLVLGTAAALAVAGAAPRLIWIPFALMLAEALHGGLLDPPVGARPAAIGIRQTIVTAVFAALVFVSYLPGI
ncbi:MAG TPA: YwiC-like family protein [Anaerolineales bacterium]|nr:YwiC-like family protein [Anaerolineales bacterium]